MKLVHLILLITSYIVTSNSIAQTQIFSTFKSTIGGQNIHYVESKNSFVYADRGHLHFYSIDRKQLLEEMVQLSDDYQQKISGIAVNDEFNYIATGDKDSIYIADLHSMEVIGSFPLFYEDYFGSTFNTLGFSNPGNELIYFDGRQIVIKEVEQWKTIDSIPYTRDVYALDMHSMYRIFVAGDERYGFDIYNLVRDECDSSVITTNPDDPYYTINQGKILNNHDVITLGFQGFDGLRLWENKKSKHYYGNAGHAGDYNGFAITPDESLIAYAEYDIYAYDEDFAILLKVVDLKTKALKHEIRIPMERQFDIDVTALALSPDGRFLATSEFYNIKIWQLY